MAAAQDFKELITYGAKLELAGHREQAAEVYLLYARELAKLSDGEDALTLLYGPSVYDEAPRRYAAALEWGFIARAAVSLFEVVRARFPSSDWASEPSASGRADAPLAAFFKWQSEASHPKSEDFAVISRFISHLKKKDKLTVSRSNAAARKTLENTLKSVGLRKTRYEDGKLH